MSSMHRILHFISMLCIFLHYILLPLKDRCCCKPCLINCNTYSKLKIVNFEPKMTFRKVGNFRKKNILNKLHYYLLTDVDKSLIDMAIDDLKNFAHQQQPDGIT